MRFQGQIVCVNTLNAPYYDVKPENNEGPRQYNDLHRLIEFLNANHGKYSTTDKTG